MRKHTSRAICNVILNSHVFQITVSLAAPDSGARLRRGNSRTCDSNSRPVTSSRKRKAPVIARPKQKYEPRGLRVLTPTRRYGDVPHIDHPTVQQEDQEIERVWQTSYAALDAVPHPIGETMMLRYGASSTPTLALIDREGFVRMYRPTRMTEAELARRP